MELYGYSFLREEDLMHHGIKGQKWGVRRFQNEDGSLTAAGRKRYGYLEKAADIAKKVSMVAQNRSSSIKKESVPSKVEKRYSGPDAWRTYAKDAYGTTNGKDYGLSQKEFESMMRQELQEALEYERERQSYNAKVYDDIAKQYKDLADKWSKTPLKELTEKDHEFAKNIVKYVENLQDEPFSTVYEDSLVVALEGIK